MPATPPPRSIIPTPSTPRHGAKYDSDPPYYTRKSSRIPNRDSRISAVTSPPFSPTDQSYSALLSSPPIAKRANLTRTSSQHFSPPSSAQSSPQKKLAEPARGSRQRQISGALDFVSKTSAAGALNLPQTMSSSMNDRLNPATNTAGMLPTPVKTPRKRPTEPVAGLGPTARILFPTKAEMVEEIAESPRKKGRKVRKYNGFSLDSFNNEPDGDDNAGKIEIFTDSKDRVPELDESEDNPFYVKRVKEYGGAGTSKKADKSKKTARQIARDPIIEESLKRTDGMVYVFRGKKIFRKFDEEGPVDYGPEEADLLEDRCGSPSVSHRPFTRSSIKPRLLFPTEEQRKARETETDDVDEEALTDIEGMPPILDTNGAVGSTESLAAPQAGDKVRNSPMKRIITATSPPAAGRATRASARKVTMDSSPLGPEAEELTSQVPKRVKPNSPFDSWQRTKPSVENGGKGRKREGEVLERNEGITSKRSKARKV